MSRVESRDVETAESGVADEVRWMERRGVVPDAGMAESPAVRDCKRIHTLGRNELGSELGSCSLGCCVEREVQGYSRHGR